jgi:hypothetical protein
MPLTGRMTMQPNTYTFRVTLDREDYHHLRAMAARLELTTEDCAARLIRAAIQALEGEKEIIWPIYLVQSGTDTIGTVDLRAVRA